MITIDLMKMNKSVMLLLAGLFIFAAASRAQSDDLYWTGSVFNENVGMVENIRGFDWSSSGSGLATGLGPISAPRPAGTEFSFLYQSYLFALTGPDGNLVQFPGLNSDFEYTVVAQFDEVVSSNVPVGGGFSMSLFQTTGGSFRIYYDGTPNRNVSTGFGFDDGMLIASGSIAAGQYSTLMSNNTKGIGSMNFTGATDYINPAYIGSSLPIVGFSIEGTQNYPPQDSKTSAFFKGRVGQGDYLTYIAGAKDLQLKVDSSSKFAVAPEPVSSLLFLIGGIPLGLRRLLKKNRL